MLASPARRTQQTAAALERKVKTVAELAPDGTALDAAATVALAGELLTTGATAPSAAVPGHVTTLPDDGRPWTTAYHSATRIRARAGRVGVLFVGGLVPGGTASPLVNPMLTPAGDLLTVARFGPDGAFDSGVRVAHGAMSVPSLLSTVTALDLDASRVLVVGGTNVARVTRPFGESLETMFGSPNAGIVAHEAAADTYAWSDIAALRTARWGHSTTMIPGYGVLVVGGFARTSDMPLGVLDDGELFLADELPNGTPVPPVASCDMPPDGGIAGPDASRADSAVAAPDSSTPDAAVRDAGVRDAGSGDAGRDAGP